ncbi:MAG: sugar phosphate isomerase/epimerase family protein [Propionibacteriaceae bacterium]
MRLGIFAKTFDGDIEANLAAVSAAGFDAVQYNLSIAGLSTLPEEVPPGVVDRIRRAADQHGVELAAISGTFNIAHPDRTVRTAGLARFPVLARTAVDLGIELITLSSGTRNPADLWQSHPDNTTDEAWRDSLESLLQLTRMAEDAGVTIAFEPEHTNIVGTADQGRRMLDAVGSDALKVVLDVANLIDTADVTAATMSRTIRHAIEALAGDIALAHAKELVVDRSAVPPGRGVLPWREIVHGLRQADYDGSLVVHGLAAADASTAAETLSPLLRGED